MSAAGRAVLRLCEWLGSESISLLLLIFCKLIVCLLVDTQPKQKKSSENRGASLH